MSVLIDATTRLAGVIGWPLEHTLSPAMHNAAYEALALDWAYVPLALADADDLPALVRALRAVSFVGFNVTMPYKARMLELCDEVAIQARLAGSVNAVHIRDGALIGYNTDGRGLLESLSRDLGFDPAGRRVVVLGSGGAAGAAVVALMLAKASHVSVAARRLEPAQRIIERVAEYAGDTDLGAVRLDETSDGIIESADLIVNATPLGMREDDPLPIDPERIGSGQSVYDVIYSRDPTALVASARLRGAKACTGLGMLVGQGAISIEIWGGFGAASVPREAMRTAAESALRARTDASVEVI
jgi:shikimate dehydrogenase